MKGINRLLLDSLLLEAAFKISRNEREMHEVFPRLRFAYLPTETPGEYSYIGSTDDGEDLIRVTSDYEFYTVIPLCAPQYASGKHKKLREAIDEMWIGFNTNPLKEKDLERKMLDVYAESIR